MPNAIIKRTPPQQTENGAAFRDYTRDHVQFGGFGTPAPPLVPTGGWSVWHSAEGRIWIVQLNRADRVVRKHELSGTRYPSPRAAREAAFEAGLLAYRVFSGYAYLWGLPD